jgi:hypothetical protein
MDEPLAKKMAKQHQNGIKVESSTSINKPIMTTTTVQEQNQKNNDDEEQSSVVGTSNIKEEEEDTTKFSNEREWENETKMESDNV